MKLYHYVHCPFCVRVRMTLNFLHHTFESIVLPYNDEKTPISLTGKKMLPIAQLDGSDINLNESLEIIQKLDTENRLKSKECIGSYDKVELLLNQIGKDVHSLAMPYWMWTPEFDDTSRSYFQTKKEIKRGPFYKLVNEQDSFINSLNQTLLSLESELCEFYQSSDMTLNDILIASHLWGMYIVPEFQFSPKVHAYLQSVSNTCGFNYHEDFWRKNWK